MDYLASEDVLRDFHAKTLFVPAHAGIAASGVPFETDQPLAKAALDVWSSDVANIDPIAFELQGYPQNRIVLDSIRDRLAQVIVGELSLDDAIQRIQEDIDTGLTELEQ